MRNTSGDFDIVVIGAGAAGLAAGKRLAASGLSFIILEARERIGGRAQTRVASGFPLDLGCGWLHSADRNPWTRIAAELGFTIDKTAPVWTRQSLDLGFSRQDQAAFSAASDAFYARLAAAEPEAGDFPAARLLEPGCRWNPLLNAGSAYMNGAELESVSVEDWKRYGDSHVNWRVVEGYGAAIAAFGASLPIRLGCAVTLVDHAGASIALDTSQGRVTAEAVIVTVPPPLIAGEATAFTPALRDKLSAAAVLPLGLADKLIMTVDAPDLPAGGHLFGNPDATATGSYQLRPFGRPLIEGFFGGRLAHELEAAGPGAFFDFACGELGRLFGGGFAARLALLSETAWARDPWSRGAYSHALPGHSDARAKLAAPVDERLFFAGEACSKHDFSTAHGAYLTGLEAAERAVAARARRQR
ncbi:flavin monoamine oxidase family protein [Methylocella sp.]|uniref:flavin monoamine oxidase family protein n=1 Tax=Methylocella sp. TaxID=1978226 RepID=UPI003C1DF3F3